ncbi:TlpA disulfide reductase family protein [Aquisphaera insulae]|uniref:TlpA disulfide reductase family protein n=1 Tax=Aquisphaera insulae TaxID=2712864 RepID=UPI0013ECDFF7|nr:TlpA disulfide reductase family protein [Aquisphaera insulae]
MRMGHRVRFAAWVLLACHGVLKADDGTTRARLESIEAGQAAAASRFERERQGDSTEAARRAANERLERETRRNLEAAIELARTNPEDATSFEALKFVVQNHQPSLGDMTVRALQLMLDQGDERRPGHASYLFQVALGLWQYPDAERLLRRILDRNPDRAERAAACYWLARHLTSQARISRRLRGKPEGQKDFEGHLAAEPIGRFVQEKDPAALDRKAEELLERASDEFGDVRLPGSTQTIGEVATGELFAARNLNIGQAAPEIVGTDHESKPFKLSETRGKVVVLTFTGSWCGPCVAMYPLFRELLTIHKGRPFSIVSVDTDTDVQALKKAIDSGKITWRCWWDGGMDGPIARRWGIASFPRIFVLDPQGVIRFKDVRGDDLKRAVAGLLDVPETVKPR